MAFPDIPNVHALAVLLLTVLALFLFTRERIPLESSSLFVLVVLIIGFELVSLHRSVWRRRTRPTFSTASATKRWSPSAR